jgi:hypothetical protein
MEGENPDQKTPDDRRNSIPPDVNQDKREPIRLVPTVPSTTFVEGLGMVGELNRQGLIRQMVRYATIVPFSLLAAVPRHAMKRLRRPD